MTDCKTSHKLASFTLLIIIIIAGGYFAFKSFNVNHNQNEQQATSPAPASPAAESEAVIRKNENSANELNNSEPPTKGTTSGAVSPTTQTTIELASSTPGESSPPPPSSPAAASSPETQSTSTTVLQSTTSTTSQESESPPSPATTTTTTTQHQEINPIVAQQQPTVDLTNPTTPPAAQPSSPPPPSSTTSNPDLEFPPNFTDRTELELEAWRQFNQRFNRNYQTREESLHRQAIFLANYRFIQGFNARRETLFTLDINHMADFTRDEINSLFIGPQMNWAQTIQQLQVSVPPAMQIIKEQTSEIQSIDWRNITAEVVDQGSCRESSIFATVASIESALNAQLMAQDRHAAPLKLSEHQVIDCMSVSTPPNNPPICFGFTSMVNVFNLLQSQPISLTTASSYLELLKIRPPGKVCESAPGESTARAKLNNYMVVNRDNIPDAITSSPVAVALDASQSTFHFYKSGLYHDDNCSLDSYNHHALLVGYYSGTAVGTDQAYYLVRNSFGPNWGEAGHFRLLKDEQRNKCLPQNLAIYPNLAL